VPRPPRLTPDELAAALPGLPHWSGDADGLARSVELPSFRTAVEALVEVADAAEAMDHHPDVDLRWRTLHFSLSTHSAGGVTELDLELARRIDEVVDTYTAPPDPATTAVIDAVFEAARRRRAGGG
jgi:4a-hydroxytetrahydrobiopterin dehydratase